MTSISSPKPDFSHSAAISYKHSGIRSESSITTTSKSLDGRYSRVSKLPNGRTFAVGYSEWITAVKRLTVHSRSECSLFVGAMYAIKSLISWFSLVVLVY